MPVNKVIFLEGNRQTHAEYKHKRKHKIKRKIFSKRWQGALIDNCRHYLSESSMHGFKYVGNPTLTWLERSFFVAAILMVLGLSCYFIVDNYSKWSHQPILMSAGSKAIGINQLPFSAVTICNVNQAQKSVVTTIHPHTTREFFLKNVCGLRGHRASSKFTEKWQAYQQFLFEVSQPCDEMLRQCSFGSVSYRCMEIFATVLTDDGLCCTFNSVHSSFLIKPSMHKSYHPAETEHQLVGTPVDWTPHLGYPAEAEKAKAFYPRTAVGAGLSLGLRLMLDANKANYYCVTTNCDGFKVLLHDPTEIPKIRDFGFAVAIGQESRVVISASIVNSTPSIRNISPALRECVFPDEGHLEYFRTYSRKNCQRECESKFVEKTCNCVHFSMPRTNANTRICSQKSNDCYEQSMRTLVQDQQRHNCDNCLPSCAEISFTSIPSSSKLWMTESQLEMLNVSAEYLGENIAVLGLYYKTSFVSPLIRDQYINFTLFVSNIGGVLGLSFGFSVISLVEILYFCALRPCVKSLRLRRHPNGCLDTNTT